MHYSLSGSMSSKCPPKSKYETHGRTNITIRELESESQFTEHKIEQNLFWISGHMSQELDEFRWKDRAGDKREDLFVFMYWRRQEQASCKHVCGL